MRNITVSTRISDVDELMKIFIKKEEHKFSLFRHSNDQAAEIEWLEENVQDPHKEEMEYKEEANNNKNGRREEMIKLEKQIKSVDEQTAVYELKCHSHQHTLEEVNDDNKVNGFSVCVNMISLRPFSMSQSLDT